MSTILGSGNYRYKVIENWAQLPDQWSFMDVAGVAVNSKDEVFVFNRGSHPMIIFDIKGNYLRSWGEVSYTNWPYSFGEEPKPKFLKTLQKLERIIN